MYVLLSMYVDVVCVRYGAMYVSIAVRPAGAVRLSHVLVREL